MNNKEFKKSQKLFPSKSKEEIIEKTLDDSNGKYIRKIPEVIFSEDHIRNYTKKDFVKLNSQELLESYFKVIIPIFSIGLLTLLYFKQFELLLLFVIIMSSASVAVTISTYRYFSNTSSSELNIDLLISGMTIFLVLFWVSIMGKVLLFHN